MISRVAESCFWLHRYVERAESTARLLQVNRDFVLEVGRPRGDRWRPVVVVSGQEAPFRDAHGVTRFDDGERVQDYMTWDAGNPVSIVGSVRWARENARTIREVISTEMWQTINALWNWLVRGRGRRAYDRDRAEFYTHVKDSVAHFQGECHNTMMHEEPFDFMRLGMLLERGMQTARTLDVKHHMLGPTRPDQIESPAEAAQWMALLRSCSATEPFFKHSHGAPTGRSVAEFLLREKLFPRSVLHCLDRGWNFARRIRRRAPPHVGRRSTELLAALVREVESRPFDDVLEGGIHAELTRIIDATTEICTAIHADYFDPPLELAASDRGASQA